MLKATLGHGTISVNGFERTVMVCSCRIINGEQVI